MRVSKNMPILRFNEFHKGWDLHQLDSVVHKKISYGIVQAGEHIDNGMPYIKSQNLNTELKLSELQRTSEEIAKKYQRSEVRPGDIVFSLRGNIGVSRIVPESIQVANLTQGTARIAVLNKFNNRFIYLSLQSIPTVKQILEVSKGSTFQEISLEALRKVKIHIPSLPEQQKIASFLSAVDEKIQQLMGKKELLEQYKKGVMQQLFSGKLRFKPDYAKATSGSDENGKAYPKWEEKRLGDVAKLQGGYAFKSQLFRITGIPVIRISNISNDNNFIDLSNVVFYDEISNAYNFTIKNGDLILAMSGATTGKSSIYNLPYDSYLNQRVGLFRTKTEKLVYEFLIQFVFSEDFQKQLDAVLVAGAQPNVSSSEIESFSFRLPCIQEQQKIASYLSAIDTKIESVATQITQTQTFKKGLLQQMFV